MAGTSSLINTHCLGLKCMNAENKHKLWDPNRQTHLQEKEELTATGESWKSKLQFVHPEPLFWNFPNTVSVFILHYTLHWNILQLLILLQDRIQLGKRKALLTSHQRNISTRHTIWKLHLKAQTKYCNALILFFILSFTLLMIEKEMA